MDKNIENLNPTRYPKVAPREIQDKELDEEIVDEFDEREIFDLITDINDPEHPLTLGDMRVVCEDLIQVNNQKNEVIVHFRPTIPHCSMATLIGLSIRVQLLRSLPQRFKVHVRTEPGSHVSEQAVNKQLADKERVAAAAENNHLMGLINQCVSPAAIDSAARLELRQ